MSDFSARKIELLDCVNLQTERLGKLEGIQRKIRGITAKIIDLASRLEGGLGARELYEFPREIKAIMKDYRQIIPEIEMKDSEGKLEVMAYGSAKRWMTIDANTLFVAEALAKSAKELTDEAVQRIEEMQAAGNLPKLARECQLYAVDPEGKNGEQFNEKRTVLSDEETAQLLIRRLTKARQYAAEVAEEIRRLAEE
ncbi:MAG: hypothetical protein Q4F60_00380 [Candidatus Saccharibacteria bacterium]|nr:hypothetical protein [Candidatus Saccharibacteria bacterium]